MKIYIINVLKYYDQKYYYHQESWISQTTNKGLHVPFRLHNYTEVRGHVGMETASMQIRIFGSGQLLRD